MAHELPALPYPKEALEPHIDTLTMEIHHGRHHKAYVDNLNKAIAGNADCTRCPDGTTTAFGTVLSSALLAYHL